jgi:hypothetical protein
MEIERGRERERGLERERERESERVRVEVISSACGEVLSFSDHMKSVNGKADTSSSLIQVFLSLSLALCIWASGMIILMVVFG